MKKIYQFYWTKEGFLWRRWNYVILPPKGKRGTWELRKIYGEPGMQKDELEATAKKESEIFRIGNEVIRKLKRISPKP